MSYVDYIAIAAIYVSISVTVFLRCAVLRSPRRRTVGRPK